MGIHLGIKFGIVLIALACVVSCNNPSNYFIKDIEMYKVSSYCKYEDTLRINNIADQSSCNGFLFKLRIETLNSGINFNQPHGRIQSIHFYDDSRNNVDSLISHSNAFSCAKGDGILYDEYQNILLNGSNEFYPILDISSIDDYINSFNTSKGNSYNDYYSFDNFVLFELDNKLEKTNFIEVQLKIKDEKGIRKITKKMEV